MAKAELITFPEKSPYKPETAEPFLQAHEAFVAGNEAPQWVQALRKEGAKAAAQYGLPTPRLERWKYTNLIPAVRDLAADTAQADISVTGPEGLVRDLAQALDEAPDWLAAWLSEKPSGEEVYKDRALWHLANAYARDGLLVDVPANYQGDKPVDITVTSHDKSFAVPRVVIRVGKGAELTIIEHHKGKGHFWHNALTQIHVEANARLHHYRIQDDGAEAAYTQNTHVKVERDATYEAFTLTTGAGVSRNQIHVELLAENATCNLYGVNLLDGKQLGDTTITIEHKAPHCNSNQFYRSVLDDQARGVFQGKVHVHQVAQKTDGYQLSNALILSEGAQMDTKPELEIYADDVKCSHGATTGQLNEDSLFYMRARGLSEAEAKRLLIQAFVHEVADKLADKQMDNEIAERVQQWLDR